jgi:hypothetical protein
MGLLTYVSSVQQAEASPRTRMTLGQTSKVKWFPGANMHKVIRIAARRGMYELRKLLDAVGNDAIDLERSLYLSKLISKMRIS